MKILGLAAVFSVLAGGVIAQETPSPLPAELTAGEWQILAIDGKSFPQRGSFALTADGQISGQAPCNRYFGQNNAKAPDLLGMSQIAMTQMACPELPAEGTFIDALSLMTTAEIREGHLILSGPEGRRMEFVRDLGDKALVCLTCD